MKKLRVLIILGNTIFLIACQKEISVEELDKPGGNNNSCVSNSILIKTVSRKGTDSIVTNYAYDGSGRLSKERITGIWDSADINSERQIVRDANGTITKIIYKDGVSSQAGTDSSSVFVFYNAATNKYTHMMQEQAAYGQVLKDSLVIEYNAADNVGSMDAYTDLFSGGVTWQLNGRFEYSFNANATSMVQTAYSFNPASQAMELNGTMVAEFDNKINPIPLGLGEAMILTMQFRYSVHNQTSITFDYVQVPEQNKAYATTYAYNACNKPATSRQTISPGNVVSNTTYYYQ